jgi:fumarate reductase (CoM/CoB) subunit A
MDIGINVNTDVLVVGGGGAGAMAAVKAKAQGARVVAVNKGPYPSGNTSLARGGYAVALGDADNRDNPQVHLEDIIKTGMVNNAKVVKAWTNEIIGLTRELDSWGIDFIKTGNKFFQDPGSGHTYPRIVRHHNAMGRALTKSLREKSGEMGVEVLEHLIIGGLLTSDEQVVGAWGIQYQTGQLIVINAKATVVATGGLGNIFPVSDSARGVTGEGYVLVFRAGAELVDMEMADYQMTPCYPEGMKGHGANAGLFLESVGVRLYNGIGERFVKKYYPNTTEKGRDRSLIARCIAFEVSEGRVGEHGGIYLDISDMTPDELGKAYFKPVVEGFRRAGVDLSYQPMELLLAIHTFLGGARIDDKCSTSLKGLFACGEAAGGLHGATRMGASALSSMLATGSIAGRNAAHYALALEKQLPCDEDQISSVKRELDALASKKEGLEPSELKRSIHAVTGKYLHMVKDATGLTKALQELKRIEHEMVPQLSAWQADQSGTGMRLRDAIEADGQLELAQIMATAALCRQESRGGHYRKDYPTQDDDNWLKNIVLKRERGAISYRTVPVVKA